jgi:hypothetical protein
MTARLTWCEMLLAAITGFARRIQSRVKNKSDNDMAKPKNNEEWGNEIEGAGGEMAFAKWANVYWHPGVGTYKAPDVGGYQVRTRTESWYDLIVRNNDKDDDRFALVLGKMPDYQIVGWISGREAKQDRWRRNHGGYGPAWFVPQAALHKFPEREKR